MCVWKVIRRVISIWFFAVFDMGKIVIVVGLQLCVSGFEFWPRKTRIFRDIIFLGNIDAALCKFFSADRFDDIRKYIRKLKPYPDYLFSPNIIFFAYIIL